MAYEQNFCFFKGNFAFEQITSTFGSWSLEVNFETMAQVSRFCSFQLFLDGEKAFGAIRFDIGRASNTTLATVALPLRMVIEWNRSIPGLVSFFLKFPCVRFNGSYGTPDHPQIDPKHILKNPRVMDKVVQYVKDNLPNTHALARKGWTALPRLQWELDDEAAVQH